MKIRTEKSINKITLKQIICLLWGRVQLVYYPEHYNGYKKIGFGVIPKAYLIEFKLSLYWFSLGLMFTTFNNSGDLEW